MQLNPTETLLPDSMQQADGLTQFTFGAIDGVGKHFEGTFSPLMSQTFSGFSQGMSQIAGAVQGFSQSTMDTIHSCGAQLGGGMMGTGGEQSGPELSAHLSQNQTCVADADRGSLGELQPLATPGMAQQGRGQSV